MVNIFGRAAILTLLILTAWFLLSTALEGERNAKILAAIDSITMQEEATSAYLDYLESTGNIERYCTVFKEHIQKETQKLFPLVALLDQSRQNSLQDHYESIRQQFQATNAKVYFSLKLFEQKCTDTEGLNQPILYFFPDNQTCSDCLLQAQILNEIRDTCGKPLQIFAFPSNTETQPVSLLVKDYQIDKIPALVIDEKLYEGVQGKKFLESILQCT